ncbi:MAG: Gliding motility-associated ABC transporter ATP-binding protein GldA [Olavius algarvensis Delta 4 endosymbiont]|nr:MAG: Gliding motility-associated ABC transporter ATP-binding protein GldA [Olavius algarvensis Delta 4 endosymbiont]
MIQADHLTKYYKEFCAVDGISLDIRKGEILGLLGPNGAGKTTTLRMLTGYFKPTRGTIKVKDFNSSEHPLKIKQLMGYLPESAPLYHNMLVYDYLDYVAEIRGIPREKRLSRIRQLCDLCGLHNIMHKPISELSKGLKQRVGLAHAMMGDPEILILDEPTSGLDPNQIVKIRDIIKQIGREKTVILSTHILSEAEATCDRIVIINRGKIIANGSAAELKQSDASGRILYITLNNAEFTQVQPVLEAINGVTAVTRVDADNSDQLAVRLTCVPDSDLRETVYRQIKETDWLLMEFRQEARTLETIFRELTRGN